MKETALSLQESRLRPGLLSRRGAIAAFGAVVAVSLGARSTTAQSIGGPGGQAGEGAGSTGGAGGPGGAGSSASAGNGGGGRRRRRRRRRRNR
jgi:hypothetical protein